MPDTCAHEPLIPDDPTQRDIGGVVAINDHVLPPLLPPSRRIFACKHCGVPLDMGHDPRRRVTRSWLIDHGYADPFAETNPEQKT